MSCDCLPFAPDCSVTGGTYQVLDNFNRSTTPPNGGLGTASGAGGHAWSGTSRMYVDGSAGHVGIAGNNSTSSSLVPTVSFAIPFVLSFDASLTLGSGSAPDASISVSATGWVATFYADLKSFFSAGANNSTVSISHNGFNDLRAASPHGSAVTGAFTMELTELGLTAGGLFAPWRLNTVGGVAGTITTLATGTVFTVVGVSVHDGDIWVINEISAKDRTSWGVYCSGTPKANQPIQDELVATWNGSTTVYTTDYPYNPQTLEVEAAGEGVEVDPTDYKTGTFTLRDTSGMTVGDKIYATYLYPCA